MLTGDVKALVVSYVYVFAIIAVAELVRHRLRLPVDFTRKVVHVGVGIWVVPTLLLFTDWRWAIVPPATFVVLNLLSYRFRLVGSMEEEGTGNLGTILFPIAFMVLIVVFWPRGRPDVVAGGILVLALGDAAAAIVGRRLGRHRYRVGSAERSIEGSAAMAVFSWLGLLAATTVFPVSVAPGALVAVALIATALEAVSVYGFDNILVPAGTAFALYGLAGPPI